MEKWKNCSRTLAFFEESNKDWLDGDVLLIDPTSSNNAGRPPKEFTECTFKNQVHKVAPLVNKNSCDELVVATRVSLYKAGKRNASEVVSLMNSDAEVASKIKKTVVSGSKYFVAYTPEEALALYVDGGFTKHSYKLMQSGAKKKRNANIYPTYDALLSAKVKCYPLGVQITDSSAEVSLQSLVDHTATRIVEAHKDVFVNLNADTITAIYKWGCDGSSGHSTYRQSFNDPASNKIDEHLFAVCLVPLQVQIGSLILWQNSRPSSTRFCRPIKLICKKESSDLISAEIENVRIQITKIIPTVFESFQIHHQFHMTMIDGKIFSVVAGSSSQTCGICGATPKVMNDLDAIKNLPLNTNMYEYGLSTLHAWIRCFECILHIGYRLPIKKWQIRSTDKTIVDQTKFNIQEKLRKEMNILVDIPTPGSGNTNNGNTARRFFQQPQLSADLTGVNEELITRFSVILRTMACGYKVNTDAFRIYCLKTAELFVNQYPWFYMPSSVHKILIHGADIISNVSLPIGMMSEEAQEARNKDLRNYRQHHTRKNSRENTMEDLMHALLFSSDPVISSISKRPSNYSRNNIKLDEAVLNLLADQNMQDDDVSSNSSDSE